MRLSNEQLTAAARELDFRPPELEKSVELLALLNAIRSNATLHNKWALKGGTALNLFVWEVPRLSIDIDLNYLGNFNAEELAVEKPAILQSLRDVFLREGFSISREPKAYAGGKWELRYSSALGTQANLHVDLVFLFRLPLWEPQELNSVPLAGITAKDIPVLDKHELAGGKLAALFSRTTSRDLVDAVRVLEDKDVDSERLRLAFVVYGGMSDKTDWRTISGDALTANYKDFADKVVPLLRRTEKPTKEDVERLLTRCRAGLERLLPLRANEVQFLDALLDHGQIEPELLTDNPQLQSVLAMHPSLLWKAQNVRKHRGLV